VEMKVEFSDLSCTQASFSLSETKDIVHLSQPLPAAACSCIFPKQNGFRCLAVARYQCQ